MTHPVEEMWTPPPRQRQRHPIIRRVALISVALLVALVAAFIFIYQRAGAELDERVHAESAVSGYAAVFFTPAATSTMSYDNIVTLMSSYGMRLYNSVCAPYDAYEPHPESQEHYWSLKNTYL